MTFADDASLIITGKNLEEIWCILGDCYEEVQRCIGSAGLELADHKTEAVLFTSRKKVETIILDVGLCTITSQPNIRYLVVMLDTRLSFKAYLQYAVSKAVRGWNSHLERSPQD